MHDNIYYDKPNSVWDHYVWPRGHKTECVHYHILEGAVLLKVSNVLRRRSFTGDQKRAWHPEPASGPRPGVYGLR